jgi:hypothetical protein
MGMSVLSMELKFVLEKYKNDHPIAREMIQVKALEIGTSLKIPRQDFKASKSYAT